MSDYVKAMGLNERVLEKLGDTVVLTTPDASKTRRVWLAGSFEFEAVTGGVSAHTENEVLDEFAADLAKNIQDSVLVRPIPFVGVGDCGATINPENLEPVVRFYADIADRVN